MSRARPPHRLPLWPALLLGVALTGISCGQPEAPSGEAAHTSGTLVEHVVAVLDPQFPDAPYEIDIGRVPYGETARRTVHLRNDSGAPLVIRSVRPGCSCTSPILSYVDPETGAEVRADARGRGDVITIPPGVAFDMELAIDSTISPARNQNKVVVVRMTTDSLDEPYLTFNMHVLVESHFLPAPARLDLRQVSQFGGAQGVLTLRADSPEGRMITGIESSPRDVLAGLTERREAGTLLWDLNLQLLPPIQLGPQRWTVRLATSGPNGEGRGTPIEVEVSAIGAADVAIEPAIILLDPTPIGQAATNQARLVTRLSGQRLRLRSARVEGELAEAFEVEAVPRAPDDDGASALWTLRLVAVAEPAEGAVSGRLVVELDDVEPTTVEARMHYRP